ncbi:AMP-binding protein [Nesterenkonia ebinurensis]|uniref:AMP-binding protein n=1 Tax=Nesterenkonia ebinurensis TaxID=2608252 RepID=UPI00123D1445|nr:AMP-binding protein [Nesterenkonia ebinurensis]
MNLSPSAHQDTFCRDSLPPEELWPTLEFPVPEVQYPERLNAGKVLIDDAVAQFGYDKADTPRPALRTPDGTVITYPELQRRADQVAHMLTQELGVVPGNRVMLRAPNNPWLVACWLGVLKAGAVVVTIMPILRHNEVANLVELTKPTVALIDDRFLEGIDVEALGVPVVPVAGSGTAAEQDELTQRASKYAEPFEAVDTAADDVALLGPTSGSTGIPKITMHFHRDILANADTFSHYRLQPTKEDIFAGSPPLAFTFGLGGLVVFPLRVGASSLLTERATPLQLAELAAEHQVTVLFTAPTAYRAIVKEGRGELLHGLRVGVSAGEHLPATTWQEVYEATGVKLLNGIGATELLHVFVSTDLGADSPGKTGKPVPGYRARIIDEDGNDVPQGETGRLAVIGPTGCRYLNDVRQKKYVFDGWNITGDTFYQDTDGDFVYKARSDSMIISSGYNIGAPEVEEAINTHPAVWESGVVGKPDSERGNIVCAFVVLREGETPSDELKKVIQDHVKATIAPYKYPREVHFIEALPKNPSGKTQHFLLRDLAAA